MTRGKDDTLGINCKTTSYPADNKKDTKFVHNRGKGCQLVVLGTSVNLAPLVLE